MKKPLFHFNVANCTSVGLRNRNEDASFIGFNESHQGIAIVCDGVGSVPNSELASYIVVEVFKNYFNSQRKITFIKQWFKKVLYIALKKVTEVSMKNLHGEPISTTLCVTFINNNGTCYVFWLGDTRLYLHDPKTGTWSQKTSDHNVWNFLTKNNASQESFTKYQDDLMTLTHYIESGMKKIPKWGFDKFKIENGSLIYLASDGAYNFCPLQHINNFIKQNRDKDFEEVGASIVKESLRQGSNDNITVIVVETLSC